MSTQKKNEAMKKSDARIAVGDLKAKGDVRGGAVAGKKQPTTPTLDPIVPRSPAPAPVPSIKPKK